MRKIGSAERQNRRSCPFATRPGVNPGVSLCWQQNYHCFSLEIRESRSLGWEGADFSPRLETTQQILRHDVASVTQF